MKKIFLFSFILFSFNNVSATVGGSITYNDFKYNPNDESIYYIKYDGGGRGCPPVLEKISLETGLVEVVFSCDDGESLIKNNWEDRYLINKEINEITKDFKILSPISLKNDNVEIDLEYLRDNFFEEEEFLIDRTFLANIYQDKILIDQIEISACNVNEPFLFNGYRIPGFEKKIVILMSAKRDCFEGGYVSDSLFIVENIRHIKEVSINSYKGNSPIQPDEHTLIVFEADEVVLDQYIDESLVSPVLDMENDYFIGSYLKYLLISIISLILGILIGFVLFRKKSTLI